jgi:plastocyanin
MKLLRTAAIVAHVLLVGAAIGRPQALSDSTSRVIGRVDLPRSDRETRKPALVVWLNPVGNSSAWPSAPPGHFTLVQKNRTFSPHLLVVPLGSVVSFPNADPFFHNVFSLFNGKRFDLGLYEAGSTKDVVFSREGVSYIFCNIHPEMSAVVLSLRTPFVASADSSANFAFPRIPPGDYDLNVWIEGTPQPALNQLARRIHVRQGADDNLVVDASSAPRLPDKHMNKFDKPYEHDNSSTY